MPNELALLIPAYNAEPFLPRLLETALAQTQPFNEIWVFDDGSTDRTAEVALAYGARLLSADVNVGCSEGKNRLAKATTCAWIHFHDADDELLPGFSERARAWMSDGIFDVVLFAYSEYDNIDGRHLADRRFDSALLEKDALSYAINNQINPFCGLYRRSSFLAAGGYDTDPTVLYNEDVAMHIRLALAGLRFTADEHIEIINNRRIDSMSSANIASCVAAQFEVMRKTLVQAPEAYRGQIARRLWQISGVAAAMDQWQTADAAAQCAGRLGCRADPGLFAVLCSISPRLAVRAREYSIRLVRPHLRSARAPACWSSV